MHLLIVKADFYTDLLDELEKGARQELEENAATCDVVSVPGALELPGAIAHAAMTGKYDGYVALGVVIRGETTHYETVCNESARGLMDLSVQKHLCIGNGIQTVEDAGQAWARARVSEKNKGGGAAAAALAMIKLKNRFSAES